MTLSAGTELGPFEILDLLGVGGMGEVYRARDKRLRRDVALKVLPSHLADDADRLERFEREAKMLASLTHPNIAAIFEVGESDGVHYIVMELVEGQTLAERIQAGKLGNDEILDLFSQIAEGLQEAHARGVIHRDLKPANIKITPQGKAKILDFGLAKALRPEAAEPVPGDTLALSSDVTGEGKILGTPAFMSPEQVRGQATDKRTDIWAFGCCLYLVLCGSRPFDGKTPQDMLASVLEREPDWAKLPSDLPTNVEVLVRRCLQKPLHRRLQDIGDARIELEEAQAGSSEYERVVARRGGGHAAARSNPGLPAALVLVVLGVMIGGGATRGLLKRPAAPERESVASPQTFEINYPLRTKLPSTQGTLFTIAPAGDRVVFSVDVGEEQYLMARAFDERAAKPIEGTENANSPFFSPDGSWIGFFTPEGLKKVPAGGGEATRITEYGTDGLGGSWGEDGTIVFSSHFLSGLYRISSHGGEVQKITGPPDDAQSRETHLWPQILPGGGHVLFTSWPGGGFEAARIEIVDLETGERTVVIKSGRFGKYVGSGHLLFTRLDRVYIQRFDLSTMSVSGIEQAILPRLANELATGATGFDVSADGTLVFLPEGYGDNLAEIVALKRGGEVAPLTVSPRGYSGLRASPDGRHLAVAIFDGPLSILDRERDTLNPLRPMGDPYILGSWIEGGERFVYSAALGGEAFNLFVSDRGGAEHLRLTTNKNLQAGGTWRADPPALLFSELDPVTRADILAIDFANRAPSEPQPVLDRAIDDLAPALSPDGHWLAYVSKETGGWDVFLRSYPDLKDKIRVSTEHGFGPVWAPDGSRLYYQLDEQRIMAVDVVLSPELEVGRPYLAYEGPFVANPIPYFAAFDVDANGDVLFLRKSEVSERPALVVVLNWFEELRELMPETSP